MEIRCPVTGVSCQCESVLRTLPRWFGIEQARREYALAADEYTTFVAFEREEIVAFITIREHFAQAWEVHCIAVAMNYRGKGIGHKLHERAERWLTARHVRFLQVKTLAESHPSSEYAETRRFYNSVGYASLEVFPLLWSEKLPVLQLIKAL